MEQFANSASTVLNGSIPFNATSLVVASAGLFPPSGNFRILVESELMLVTAVIGTTFVVTRGVENTIPTFHSIGVPITHILTAGALVQLRTDAEEGGGGGPGYLPPTAPPINSANILVVNGLGVTSWQPLGGYEITGFTISGAGVAALVEVGSTQPVINWAATFDFVPASISVTCTGQPTQTPSPSGMSSSGTFTGPFTSATNGTTIALSITVIDPNGAPHTSNTTMTYAVKIVWGSITSPIAGQGLWNSLNGQNNHLSTGLNATMSFASASGQQQTFATLASLGTPILHDSGGDSYPPVSLGSLLIMENGTSQTMSFWTVGVPGITFSWIMS